MLRLFPEPFSLAWDQDYRLNVSECQFIPNIYSSCTLLGLSFLVSFFYSSVIVCSLHVFRIDLFQ